MSLAAPRNPHTIDLLVRDIGDAALLTADEEVALGRTIRSPDADPAGRDAAIRRMVEANIRLVIHEAKKVAFPGEDLGDLVSDGTLGLGTAARKWDPDRGIRFSTYAVYWIRQSISRARINHAHGRPWTIPVHLHAIRREVERHRRRLADAGEEVSIEEAARRLGKGHYARHLRKVDAVALQMRVKTVRVPTSGSDSTGEIGSDNVEAAMTDDSSSMQERIDSAAFVHRYLGRLTPSERAVVRLYYGFDPLPCGDVRFADKPGGLIAAHLGISRERVRQVRQSALAKIRRWAEEEGCL